VAVAESTESFPASQNPAQISSISTGD